MFAAKMEAAHPPAPQEIDLLLSLLSETVNGSPGSSSAAHPLRFESSDASSEGLRVEYADSGQEPLARDDLLRVIGADLSVLCR